MEISRVLAAIAAFQATMYRNLVRLSNNILQSPNYCFNNRSAAAAR
jgi:hypothetical protein